MAETLPAGAILLAPGTDLVEGCTYALKFPFLVDTYQPAPEGDGEGRAFGKGGIKIKSTSSFLNWATGRLYERFFRSMAIWPRPSAETVRGAA